jgi:hypothetical protein
MFDRKIIRRIYGPMTENNIRRIRYNEEILLEGEASMIYQVTGIKMVGACRKNRRQYSAEENGRREIVFQKRKRKTQDETARLCQRVI